MILIKAIANTLVIVIEAIVLRHPASIVFPDDVFVCVDGEAARILIITIVHLRNLMHKDGTNCTSRALYSLELTLFFGVFELRNKKMYRLHSVGHRY